MPFTPYMNLWFRPQHYLNTIYFPNQFTCFSKAQGVINVLFRYLRFLLLNSFFLFENLIEKLALSWIIQTNFDSENIYSDLLINFMNSYNALKSKRKSS